MRTLIAITLIFLLVTGCEEDEPERPFPRVRTHAVEDISIDGISLNGEITSAPGEITDHGFAISILSGNTVDLNYAQVVSLGKKVGRGRFETRSKIILESNVTYYVRAYAKSQSHVVFGEVQKFLSLGSAAPTITAVTPLTATWGDTIVISGQNYSTVKGKNMVRFGETLANVIEASAEELKVIVPFALDVRQTQLSVSVLGNISMHPENFSLHRPELLSLSTASVWVGSDVTITGKYFHPQRTKVLVGDVEMNVASTTTTELRVKIADDSPFGEKIIRIVTGKEDLEATGGITIRQPIISAISPETGTFGETITITGEGFPSLMANNQAYFGSANAQILAASPTQITVRVPEAMGVVSTAITVKMNDSEFQSGGHFTLKPPVINDISHSVAFAGEEITLTGDYFNPEPGRNSVWFNNTELEVISASRNQLVVKFPAEVTSHEQPLNVTVATQIVQSDPIYSPWIRLADFPGAYLGESVSVVYGNDVYVGTGGEWDSPNRQFYRFNTSSNSWEKLADFPAENRFFTLGFAQDGFIYMGGGLGYSDFYRYEIATDTWSRISNLPFGEYSHIGFSFPELKKHYALVYTSYLKADLMQFDADQESWSKIGSFDIDIQPNHAIYFVAGSNFYVKSYTGLYTYSTTTGSWSKLTDFSPNLFPYGFGFCFGSDCFFNGEYDYYNNPTTRTYRFDLLSNTLNDYKPYAGRPRDPGAFFQVGGKGYMVSGHVEGVFDKHMYEFVPSP